MKKIFILLILLFTFVVAIFALDHRLKIVTYFITSDKIKSPLRLIVITDLHSCWYGEKQNVLLDAINSQKPDIILFVGDICDDKRPYDNTELLLIGLEKYQKYYVTGNHEYWSKDIDNILTLFRKYDVVVLNGEHVKFINQKDEIQIFGITDPDVTKFTDFKNDVFTQLENFRNYDKNNFSILMAHRPELIHTYIKDDFDLIVSGHAHGGQWRLPFLINGLYAPDQGLFPKYAGGKYVFDNTSFIVSRGLARESTLVPRIFNRPELLVIDINSTL